MKRILLSGMILLALFSAIAYADECAVEEVRNSIKKGMLEFFDNPDNGTFDAAELQEMITFYKTLPENAQLAECAPVRTSLNKAAGVARGIPTCSDGTHYGKCSATQPYYCFAGKLVQRCRLCGCPGDQQCDENFRSALPWNRGQWGQCVAETPEDNITCSSDADCGIDDFTGAPFCEGSQVRRNFIDYTCDNPGTAQSSCSSATSAALVQQCSGTETCQDGACVPDNQTIPTSPNDITLTESGNYKFRGLWYNAASWDDVYLKLPRDMFIASYFGYYPPMGDAIDMGPMNAGDKLAFRFSTLWHENPYYGVSTDENDCMVEQLTSSKWRFTCDDGVHYDAGYNDLSFEVYKEEALPKPPVNGTPVNDTPQCQGYAYAGGCWYTSASRDDSCTTICQRHGAECKPDGVPATSQMATNVVQALLPGYTCTEWPGSAGENYLRIWLDKASSFYTRCGWSNVTVDCGATVYYTWHDVRSVCDCSY